MPVLLLATIIREGAFPVSGTECLAAQDDCCWGLAIQTTAATAVSMTATDNHSHPKRKYWCSFGIRCTAVPDFRLTLLADSPS